MKDILINCTICHTDFVFTIKEQEFFKSKNFSQPKKCKACKREEKEKGK